MSGGSEEQPHDPGQVRGFHYWRRPGRSAANSHRRGRLLADKSSTLAFRAASPGDVENFDICYREAARLVPQRRRAQRPVAVIADVHWSAIHGPGPGSQSLSLQSAVARSSGQLATGGQIAGGYLTFPSLPPRDARR